MTFLQLAQRLRQECGVSGTGPSTVLAQTGEYRRLVDWIATAWFEIQSLHQDWKFLRLSTSWTTTLGQYSYTPVQCGITADTFGRWILEEFRQYHTATGTQSEMPVYHIPYPTWRQRYNIGALRDQRTQPMEFAVAPSDAIVLGPPPLAGYTVTGDYYRSPILLAADLDVPALPAKHDHMIIVYKAMMSYGAHESDPSVYANGERSYNRLFCRLELDQLPPISMGGALC